MSDVLDAAPLDRRTRWVEARLVLALLLLCGAGGYLRYAKAHGKLQILKQPAPLQRELAGMSRSSLSPYQVRDVVRLDEATVFEMGTENYIHWELEDATAPQRSWRRRVPLLITYYTGNADQVPHVPEECYMQGGGASKEAEDVLTFHAEDGREMAVRRLRFASVQDDFVATVYYTFIANGDFYNGRLGVRRRMGRTDERYLYYCKVELAFHRFGAGKDEEEGAGAMDGVAEALMRKAVAELFRHHLPDVKSLEQQAAAG